MMHIPNTACIKGPAAYIEGLHVLDLITDWMTYTILF